VSVCERERNHIMDMKHIVTVIIKHQE
jgi:hypothetical protein